MKKLIIVLTIIIATITILNWSLKTKPIKRISLPTPTTTPQTTSLIKFILQESELPKSFSLNIVPQETMSALVYRVEILFDPQVLSVEKVSAGNFFKNPKILRNELNNDIGRIYFSAGIIPEEIMETGEPKSKDVLAIIIFKVKPQPEGKEIFQTTVSFGKETMIISKEGRFENSSQILEPITVNLNTAHE